MSLEPKQMGEAIIRNLKEKTGKSIEQWCDILLQKKLVDKKSTVDFLKKEQSLGHFQAQKIVEYFYGKNEYANTDILVDALFNSPKSKSLYEFTKSKILAIGKDIKIQSCKTYIPFYRSNQFAILTKIKNDNIMLGLNLPDEFSSKVFSSKCSKGSERINASTVIDSKNRLNQETLEAIKIAYKNN